MPEIIVAMDGMDLQAAVRLAAKLHGIPGIWGAKVNDLLLQAGLRSIEALKPFGKVMADPKLYDIPNTVCNGVKALVQAGADIITVHASGGKSMLEAAVDVGDRRIAAVTALTSAPDNELARVYRSDRLGLVARLMLLARNAGVQRVVCSAAENHLTEVHGFQTIIPGVRLDGTVAGDDQVHTANQVPDCAYLVVGRPITQAEDPVAAAQHLALLATARG